MNETDIRRFMEATEQELLRTAPPRDALLGEVKESLRNLRRNFLLFSQVVNPERAAAHADDLEALTRRWSECANDDSGLYTLADVISLTVQTRLLNLTQSVVFERHGNELLRADATAQAEQRGGCLAAVGVTALIMGVGSGWPFFLWTGGILLTFWLAGRITRRR